MEELLHGFRFDDRAKAALRECEPWLQEEVMARSFKGTHNPSVVLMARIRKARFADPTGRSPQESARLSLPPTQRSPQ